MSATYAHIAAGVVVEVIPPFVDNVTTPGRPREVPIEERYPPDFVAQLRVAPEGSTVAPNDLYDEITGKFSTPSTGKKQKR